MATQTVTLTVDDIDGSDHDVSTVTFALNGASYEIDLSEKHRDELKAALSEFISKSRRSNARGYRRPIAPSLKATSTGSRRTGLGDIRSWAKSNGYGVSDRGRISQTVVDAYDAAH